MKIRILLSMPLLIAAFAATGALGQMTAPEAPPSGTTAIPRKSQVLQNQIQQDLQNQNLNDVKVTATDGEILLSGTVPDVAARNQAVSIATQVGQQRYILNHIRVVDVGNHAPAKQQNRSNSGGGMTHPSQPEPPAWPN